MKIKWDIVDDVVSPPSTKAVETQRICGQKTPFRNALATTVFAGTLLLPAYAVSAPTKISQQAPYVAGSLPTDFIKIESHFVRPKRNRDLEAKSNVDTTIGMSIRRLAETYLRLFEPDDATDSELTGEYSFL